MTIKQTIKKINTWFKPSININIESMKQETHKPKYIPPFVTPGIKNSPRMKYKRR